MQAVDVSCLTPEAFAWEPRAGKRPKLSALLAAAERIQAQDESAPRELAIGGAHSVVKPFPAYQTQAGADRLALAIASSSNAETAKVRHAAEWRLLELSAPDIAALERWEGFGRGLAGSVLGKAARAYARAEAQRAERLEAGSAFVRASKALMAPCLRDASEAWSERLNAPCSGPSGEFTTFARCATCSISSQRKLSHI